MRGLLPNHSDPKESSNHSLTSNSPGFYDTPGSFNGEPFYEKSRRRSLPHQFIDSFRRDPNRHIIDPLGSLGDVDHQDWVYDPNQAILRTANTRLARKLKGRHLQMIAIGGSIGTGLFVASGRSLHAGGPASLLISFLLTGCMLYCTVHALGEMAVLYPVSGSFSAYSSRFLDPAWGFAMGWNYAMQWLIILPVEIIAATITIEYWNKSINPSVFVTVFLLLIISINLFGVKGYGEAEFFFSIVKVIAVIGFILLGIIINCVGGPTTGYIGGKFWVNPGPFHDGFKGLCSVFVNAAFAFAGTELVGLAAAETANPRKSLPTAIKQVFWRITLFYIVSLTLVGLLVPYNDPRLLTGNQHRGNSASSPFVIAIEDAGIAVLPSVMNAVILIAVLSVGNSSVFGSSRTLAALADQGQAPKILGYVDRKGRPVVAICLSSALGFIAYAANSDQQNAVLNWMLALSGLSSIFTWASICLAHIRFRRAWRIQGRSLDELAFVSQPGVVGSWIGFIFNCLVLMAQFWTGAWPVGYGDMTMGAQVRNFFLGYLAAPIVIVMFVGYKWTYKTKVWRCHEMDLKTGIRELNLAEMLKAERAERSEWPRWKKIYHVIC
ncbi:hypothetical protein VE00_00778 [Pseudogymnoascus sp. WSF 3629]|nr:hypothetical protein VE00_00778 [Pseudogymnoascus sp. WSF 3629]